jgi:hypothetical protein
MFNRWLAASWGQHPGRIVRHTLHSVSLSPPRLPLLLARLICATSGLRCQKLRSLLQCAVQGRIGALDPEGN